MFANLYVIPRLLGMEVTRHDISHGSNLEEPSYLNWIPEEYWALWSDADRDWARALWEIALRTIGFSSILLSSCQSFS